jgi:hypothetical protein
VGKDATAKPEAIRVHVEAPAVNIVMRPHLWYTWAMIAVREEQRAWRLRHMGLQQAKFGPYLVQEAHEAMQAVVAARHALHNLFRVWQPLLGLSGESKVRPNHFTVASLQPAWEARVLQLIDDRDGVVHHDEQTAPVQPHPQYPTNVSALEASFTAERATEAIEVMLDDVLRPAITAPAPALQRWAADIGHVPTDLDSRRTSGDDELR